MTVQYVGNHLYDIHLGHQKIVLSKNDIEEIQEFNFETMKSTESIEALQNKNEDLEEKLSDAETKIEEKDEEIHELTQQIVDYESKR